jgi:hypothetical protein
MPDVSQPESTPETDAQRLERLIPLVGEENARRLVANPPTEGQRRRLAQLVAAAPRRVSSAPSAGYNAGATGGTAETLPLP